MPFTSDIVAAYRLAHYAVLARPELVLRIGEPSARLDALLDERGASEAAFLTAYNPQSEARGAAQNEKAAAELERALDDAKYSRLAAEGRDPRGGGPAERGVLALGLPREAAASLGRRFGQNAIVHAARGSAPELVLIPARIVLDTNAWLDWLVFNDPAIAPLRAAIDDGRAALSMDEACAAELQGVLGRQFGRRTLDPAGQAAAIAEARRLSLFVQTPAGLPKLPVCRDPDDQKFLALAAAAGADFLVTKDAALLELARRPLAFRIVQTAFLRQHF